MKIKLNTIENVNELVNICNKYENCAIDVRQGNRIINGRSILGIFSLSLLECLLVSIETKELYLKEDFYNDIKKWKVDKV